MNELKGLQIRELTPAPSLNNNTEIPLQRNGITKAEKISLISLLTWLLNSPDFKSNIGGDSAAKLAEHISALDPHGDRAFATSVLSTHLSTNDAHGDRLFATNAITAAINAFKVSADPLGDRAFTTSAISTHKAATDPHGDRAFATSAISTSQIASETYTNNKISSEFTARVGTSVAPLAAGKVPNTYINQQVTFGPYSGFPGTGVATNLYVDTTNKDVYAWIAGSYQNLTPTVDVSSLALTTDSVPEGINPDRKYLSAAAALSLGKKIEDITLIPASTGVSLKAAKVGSIVQIKGLITEAPFKFTSNTNDVVLTDNTFNFEVETTNAAAALVSTSTLKVNPLAGFVDSNLYSLTGEVFGYVKETLDADTIVSSFENFKVNAKLAKTGIIEDVPPVTTAVINDTGTIISGTGEKDSLVEVYDKTYNQITSVVVDGTGSYNKTITAITDGSLLHIHMSSLGGRSTSFELYAPNLGTLKAPTSLSVFNTGLKIRGEVERLSTVTVTKETGESLGTGVADSRGFFDITLSEEVITDQVIKIKSKNALNKESVELSYTVKVSTTIPVYEVIVENNRQVVVGKADADSTVKAYLNELEVGSYETNSLGVFSGILSGVAVSENTLTFKVTKSAVDSTVVTVKTPANYTIAPKPAVKKRIRNKAFSILFSDITKRGVTENFTVVLEQVGPNIQLKVNNTSNVTTKWIANLKIDSRNM